MPNRTTGVRTVATPPSGVRSVTTTGYTPGLRRRATKASLTVVDVATDRRRKPSGACGMNPIATSGDRYTTRPTSSSADRSRSATDSSGSRITTCTTAASVTPAASTSISKVPSADTHGLRPTIESAGASCARAAREVAPTAAGATAANSTIEAARATKTWDRRRPTPT